MSICTQWPYLPVEIFTEIMNCFSEGPNRLGHLRRCCLVSRSFLSLSRPHLFRTKKISYESFESDLAFVRFEAPHLGPYVRHLVLEVLLLQGHDDQCPDYFAVCFEPFTQIRKLQISGVPLWTGLPKTLRVGFGRLLDVKTLQELELHEWSFNRDLADLKYILSFCSETLRSLTLDNAGTQAWLNGDEDEEEEEEEEEEDNSNLVPDWIDRQDDSIEMPALHTLRLLAVEDYIRSNSFIRCPSLSLFEADLKLDVRDPYALPAFIGSSIEHLRLSALASLTLSSFSAEIRPSTLTLNIRPGVCTFPQVLNWLTTFISNLPHPCSLRRVFICVSEYPVWREEFVAPSHCTTLSALFSRLCIDGQLEAVEILVDRGIQMAPRLDPAVEEERFLKATLSGFRQLSVPIQLLISKCCISPTTAHISRGRAEPLMRYT